MKRKTHKKNTGILASTNSIWSRFTLRSRTTQNIDKVNNEIKGTEQSQQTKTERENEIKEADSEMTTTDDIMPSYTHKKSITITDINVIKSREQKRDSGLYLEQKPHASDGDQSPTKSKSKRNNKNSDNNNSGSNHNKFLISPRSIAKTFTKSISPKSGTFTFGGLALPNTDLIRQGTFVEHQSIDDQSDPSEDEQDDDDDEEDDLSHDEDGAFQINTSDFYTESNLIVIDEENEIKANDPNHHSIKKQQDHMHGKKTTESEMNSILKDVLLDVNEAIDEEKEREEKERKEKLKEKEKESHTVINSLITITSMDFDIEENKNDTSRKDNVNNLNLLSPTSQSTIISMEGGIPIPSSTKRSSAIMRGFTRLSGILQHSSTMDDRDENEIDEEEKNLMEKANKVCLNDFVSLTSKAIYSILQLQYQSITRFKKTKEFILFEQSVDLNELLQKYG